jgi:hypothetical protein
MKKRNRGSKSVAGRKVGGGGEAMRAAGRRGQEGDDARFPP